MIFNSLEVAFSEWLNKENQRGAFYRPIKFPDNVQIDRSFDSYGFSSKFLLEGEKKKKLEYEERYDCSLQIPVDYQDRQVIVGFSIRTMSPDDLSVCEIVELIGYSMSDLKFDPNFLSIGKNLDPPSLFECFPKVFRQPDPPMNSKIYELTFSLRNQSEMEIEIITNRFESPDFPIKNFYLKNEEDSFVRELTKEEKEVERKFHEKMTIELRNSQFRYRCVESWGFHTYLNPSQRSTLPPGLSRFMGGATFAEINQDKVKVGFVGFRDDGVLDCLEGHLFGGPLSFPFMITTYNLVREY